MAPAFDYYAYELNKADGTELRLKVEGETASSRWISITPAQRNAIITLLNTEENDYGLCFVCRNGAMDCHINGCE